MQNDNNNLYKKARSVYDRLLSEAGSYTNMWETASDISAVKIKPENIYGKASTGQQVDLEINDATAAIANQTYADALNGMIWSPDPEIIKIRPSDYVEQNSADTKALGAYYDFLADRLLYHTNHPNAGFANALSSYTYEQGGIGTSGIGSWKNEAFLNNIEENAFVFVPYGVDNSMVDEGKNGKITTVVVVNNWSSQRIVSEYCAADGEFNEQLYNKLPENIRKNFEEGKAESTYKVIQVIMPRKDFDPRLLGKKGKRYIGITFLDEEKNGNLLREESFNDLPISICRNIKIRNEKYGRSPVTLLIQTISNLNFVSGITYDAADKMVSPGLGMFNGALMGDDILETGADSLTILNPIQGATGSPIFPIHDVGDITAMAQFLIPELKNQVTSAMKTDIMLDFNSAKEMTAQEAMARMSLRSQSLAAMLKQQEDELLQPLFRRNLNLMYEMGEAGIDLDKVSDEQEQRRLQELLLRQPHRAIPEEVKMAKAQGRDWFVIEFNNELTRVIKGQKIQQYTQFLQALLFAAQANPEVIKTFDAYKYVKDIQEILGISQSLIIDEKQFKKALEDAAAQNGVANAAQLTNIQADTNAKNAKANKDTMEANNGTR